jgi:Cu-Zn family superoxide dismutase
MRRAALIACLSALSLAAAARAQPLIAVADIAGCDGAAVHGRLMMMERPSPEGVKVVEARLKIQGLADGAHAVHIHETGACTPCSAANGHFDPGPAGASSPDGNHPFHSGDLVNVHVSGGVGMMQTTTSRFTLSPGPLSVFDADGSAVIVHVDPDSYCPEGEVKGCAGGARAACGVLRRP